jgi:hypothetical protein
MKSQIIVIANAVNNTTTTTARGAGIRGNGLSCVMARNAATTALTRAAPVMLKL